MFNQPLGGTLMPDIVPRFQLLDQRPVLLQCKTAALGSKRT